CFQSIPPTVVHVIWTSLLVPLLLFFPAGLKTHLACSYSLTPSLSLSLYISPSLSLSRSLSLYLPPSLSLSLSVYISLSFSLSIPLSISLSLSLRSEEHTSQLH